MQHCSESTAPTPSQTDPECDDTFLSEYDRHRLTLLSEGVGEDWQIELRRYLQAIPSDVTRDTDIVAWWAVCATHVGSLPLY
jgi:hypothetical protein